MRMIKWKINKTTKNGFSKDERYDKGKLYTFFIHLKVYEEHSLWIFIDA